MILAPVRAARQSPGLCLIAVAIPFLAWPCSVPVFRYALEHWDPDTYQGLVFHEGELSVSERALLEPFTGEEAGFANIFIRTIQLDDPENTAWREAWKSLGGDSLPWIAVRPEPRTGLVRPILSAPFNRSSVENLFESPAREEIASRLASGESTVWILLESGEANADEAAARTLQERLDYLESVVELPELDQADIDEGLVSVGAEDLRLAFSMLRLSRDDSRESSFVDMLLATEPDLASLGEPIVFPVFGRGRVLYALVGGGINSETIDEAALFLIGQCSCQVKEENPGADLLMSEDWAAMVTRVEPAPVASDETEGPAPEIVRIGVAGNEKGEAWRPVVGWTSLVLGAVVIAGFLLRARKGTSHGDGDPAP